MLSTFREEPKFETNNPYAGEEATYNVTVPDEDMKDHIVSRIYDCVLWYFQFRSISSDKISQYFGVMDIDIPRDEGSSDIEYQRKKITYLPGLVERLVKMNYNSYRIYASGTKGYHVYLFDLNLWRTPTIVDRSTHNLWIEQQIKTLYPLLYTELDMNIYHIGKGIRNPQWPHPKTGKASTLLIEQNAPPCIWYWISDVFGPSFPKEIDFDRSLLPPRPVVTQIIGNTLGTSSVRVYVGSLMSHLNQLYSGARITLKASNLYLVDSKHCPLKGGDHKTKGKNYLKIYGDYAVIKCHHSNCTGKSLKVLKKERPLTDFENLVTVMKIEGKILSKHKSLRVIDPAKQKHVLSSDIEWALQEGYGIISAPMGTGKTTSVIQWIEETRRKKYEARERQDKPPKLFRVLLIVTRITQAINFGTKYPGMKSYLNVEGSVADNESSVLCVNSLIRVMSQNHYALPRFDLLILDEIESIIEALISAVLSQGKSKQCNIWQLFKCLVMGSKRVLFMDGILTERTALYLDRLRTLERCNLVQHEGQPDYREYINFKSIDVFEEDYDSSCQKGKKLAIVSNSKSALYSLASRSQSPGSKLIITGDSTKEQKLTASDPNEEWSTDILGFNTAVGPGASFDEDHFDIMYVICSPASCTPYVLYQLINRIRSLREKTVKLFILYDENKTIPTKEELKMSKSSNIIKMHSRQDEYAFPLGFYEKNGTDFIKLDINTADFSVVRKLIEEQKLVLHYEDTHFVDTLVEYEHEKLKLSNTSYYSKVLFDCIRRNGGLVKGLVDYDGIGDNMKKNLKDSSRIVRKESTKKYKELAMVCDNMLTKKLPLDMNREFKIRINQHCQLNDINTQMMWSSLRRALTSSEMTVYERELEAVNDKKKAINNTLLYSTGLLESLKELCEICRLTICQARGIISGGGDYGLFTDNHEKINQLIIGIDNQLYNSTKRRMVLNKLKESRMPRDTATFKNLKLLFSQFGITLILSNSNKKRVVRGTSVRYFDKSFAPCLFTQYCRMAFSGLDYTNGLPSDNPFGVLEQGNQKI